MVGGDNRSVVVACCGVGRSSGVRLRQDQVVVETVGAGSMVWQVRLSCVDILVRQMVVAGVLDLVKDVLIKAS